ncbi:MAG: VPLPA-CTERM sorting domain-containing protein [Desulfobulbaceae bacterium]|nr:VPLPA-CTERM sorting domain-containing protein [Desulfobulbaceae bacterium]
MRKISFKVMLLVITMTMLSLPVQASTIYEIFDFTLTQGTIAPISGGFTYNPVDGFSDFSVQWYGSSIDMTAAANKPTLYSTGIGYSTGTHIDSIALMTHSLPEPRLFYHWDAYVLESINKTVFEFGSRAALPGGGETFVYMTVNNLPAIGPDTGGVQVGTFNVRPVPIPGAVWLLGSGLSGVIAMRRRKKKQLLFLAD